MSNTVPPFKESDDSKTCPADWEAFSDEPIKGYPTVESEVGHRKGFTKQEYATPCGQPKFGKGLAG